MRAFAALASALTIAGPLLAAPPAAADVDVDLELVLAVDISRSMDYGELELQRHGYIAAFRHREVVAAIASGPHGRISVTYVEWAGPESQFVVVPWTIVADVADAAAFAGRLAAEPIQRERGTSISGSLAFAAAQFPASGATGLRRAIDVSGDGPNNMGLPVVPTRDTIVGQGITINGLPILLRPSFGSSAFNIPDLDIYYEDCVIGGPGAFMITVDDPARFELAIRRKLVLEIAGLPPRVMLAAEPFRAEPRVDCLIGEKSRRQWFYDPGGP
jgi:hypothetical protein